MLLTACRIPQGVRRTLSQAAAEISKSTGAVEKGAAVCAA
jgi:hypothetical protein